MHPRVGRDLETIIHQAIARDPRDRYATADALADDLERLLRLEPILARRPWLGARLWLWARRRPAVAALAGVAFAAVTSVVLLLGYAVPRLQGLAADRARSELLSEVLEGWAELAADHRREADARFLRVLEANPADHLALAGAVRIRWLEGREVEADRLLARFGLAAAPLDRLRARRPGRTETRVEPSALDAALAPATTELDFLLEAESALSDSAAGEVKRGAMALRFATEAIARSTGPNLFAHLLRCRAATSTGDREAVETSVATLLHHWPDTAIAQHRAGLSWRRLGDHERALTHLELAVALDEDLAIARNDLGNTLLSLGRIAESIAHFRAALRARPALAYVQYNLGLALLRSNDYAGAAAANEAALGLDPTLKEARLNLGIALTEAGSHDDALRVLEVYVREAPSARGHLALATALAGKGQLDEAALSVASCLAKAPADQSLQRLCGLLLLRMGRLEAARDPLLRSIELARAKGMTDPRSEGALVDLESLVRARSLLAPGGGAVSSRSEWLDLARVAGRNRLHSTAAELAARAIAATGAGSAEPSLAELLLAATFAVRAAHGEGAEAASLDPVTRVEWLRRAVRQLELGLACARASLAADAGAQSSVIDSLRGWRKTTSFPAIDDEESARGLPEDLAADCRSLRAALDALLADRR